MKPRVFVCRIAWMDFYRGVTQTDRPVGGGSYVAEMGFGHEAFNFAKHNGCYYGYVQPAGSGIKVARLGASQDATKVKNVTVVWVATHPIERGLRVVGWHEDAIVFAERQDSPSSARQLPDHTYAEYFVSSRRAVLLERDERVHSVPLARESPGHGMGQANVWYPKEQDAADLIRYMKSYQTGRPPRPRKKKGPHLPDTERRLRIERVAMETTARWFEDREYIVTDVSAQRLGWDLEARRRKAVLRIEVKGTYRAAPDATVDVTPNEYGKMAGKYQASFRLCVVCNAEREPDLFVFAWSHEANAWTARNGTYRLDVNEMVGARLSLAEFPSDSESA